MINHHHLKIGVIGLGYVGLPLAVEFAKKRPVIGFDTNNERVSELRRGVDSTLEIRKDDLQQPKSLHFTSEVNSLSSCNCFIVTVPTPVTASKQPDVRPLVEASKTIASVLSEGDIVIYESTVYPGATEELCVPVLEVNSGLKFNTDFFVGYSPERINPGDKEHRVTDIVKVTSGSTDAVAGIIDALYNSIIKAGTFKATSIMVAEAAKVIENTQRDINIALINELAVIFNTLKIDTEDVLQAAGSKWNFLPFRPGLVGGHCIGVDPYYLTFKAQLEGYDPKMILAGRKINDGMGAYVAQNLVKHMSKALINMSQAKVLIMGFSFKENCPDIRNTKVFDVFKELREYSIDVDIYDPWVKEDEAKVLYDVKISQNPKLAYYDAAVVAVGHTSFKNMGYVGVSRFLKPKHLVYDLKYLFEKDQSIIRL
jgi:UDP-N-acetyl-D-glucosamine/UDP-N-acetyl-D-galactosamine dehydrogenase